MDKERNFGHIVGDARKRIMGEWDNFMATPEPIPTIGPDVPLIEPQNPGHTISHGRHKILEGGLK